MTHDGYRRQLVQDHPVAARRSPQQNSGGRFVPGLRLRRSFVLDKFAWGEGLMQIIPAVDIKDGRCVRLLRGDFDRQTVYAEDPVQVALHWQQLGAEIVHVVDLDGSRSGRAENNSVILDMLKVGIPLQVGGGIRSTERAEILLEAGAQRIVLGTAAVSAPSVLQELIDEYPRRLVVGVDCREGRVAVQGWTEESCRLAGEFCRDLADRGVRRVLVTDIDRDGTLSGPGMQLLRGVLDSGMRVIASGGVGCREHVQKLAGLSAENPMLEAVIIGRALYDGTLCFLELLREMKQE